jgi:hypothetical protein
MNKQIHIQKTGAMYEYLNLNSWLDKKKMELGLVLKHYLDPQFLDLNLPN